MKKYAKNIDNKNLPSHKARSTARFIVRPTLAKEEAYIYNPENPTILWILIQTIFLSEIRSIAE